MFQILLYKTYKDLQLKSSLVCGSELEFTNTDSDEMMTPIFIIHSYDSKIEHFNHQKMVKKLIQMRPSELSNRYISSTTSQTRPKRGYTPKGCRVEPLFLRKSEISPYFLGIHPNGSMLLPKSYNAGICGGACNFNMPADTFSKHASFIHFLLNTPSFRQRQRFTFKQCCVPMNYTPLTVIYMNEKEEIKIKTAPNMILDTCNCVDVIETTY